MRSGVMTVYRWELRKLRAQKRTYLGLGAAAAVPIIFVTALVTGGGRPNDVAFGRYVHDTGLAVPLVLLLFGSIWLFPLITALVAGDIVRTPADEWHWHGAAPDHFMTHLSITEAVPGETRPEADWGEHVTDDEYNGR